MTIRANVSIFVERIPSSKRIDAFIRSIRFGQYKDIYMNGDYLGLYKNGYNEVEDFEL